MLSGCSSRVVLPAPPPLLLLSQGGHDSFHARGGADADAFFSRALALEAELGVTVHHETHRGRLLFNPWDAADAVARHPRLRLLGDLSHYCAVCEAACGDAALEAAVARILPHVRHVHLRVGFAEGPQVRRQARARPVPLDHSATLLPSQVPDPRMPAFAAQLTGHAAWWAAVFDAAAARGDAEVTATPEFLPVSARDEQSSDPLVSCCTLLLPRLAPWQPPYCWTTAPLPASATEPAPAPVPVTDVAAANAFMAAFARELFDKRAAAWAAEKTLTGV